MGNSTNTKSGAPIATAPIAVWSVAVGGVALAAAVAAAVIVGQGGQLDQVGQSGQQGQQGQSGGGGGTTKGAPGPVAGAGLPVLLIAGGYALVRRYRNRSKADQSDSLTN